jgi:hypothetical protein
MRIELTPKEDMHVRVKYNGATIHDQDLTAGTAYVIEAEHPKCCGVAEAFLVDEDGSEMPIGSANYGDCDCGKAAAPAAV